MNKKYIRLLILFFVIIVVFNSYVNAEENKCFKNWCEETFDNGGCIYEAYKDIAFNIKYEPEEPKTDYWQTPVETERLKKGDCEDGVFYFVSHFSEENCENAEIVWGWVIYKKTGIAKAHVWCQLIDKKREEYIVEGFSGNWNGIIPIKMVDLVELRKPLLRLSFEEYRQLKKMSSGFDSKMTFRQIASLHCSFDYETDYEDKDTSRYGHRINDRWIIKQNDILPRTNLGFTANEIRYNKLISREIVKIFMNLHDLFIRF